MTIIQRIWSSESHHYHAHENANESRNEAYQVSNRSLHLVDSPNATSSQAIGQSKNKNIKYNLLYLSYKSIRNTSLLLINNVSFDALKTLSCYLFQDSQKEPKQQSTTNRRKKNVNRSLQSLKATSNPAITNL